MPEDPGENTDPDEQFVIDTILSGRPDVPDAVVRVDAGDDTAVLADGTLVTTDTLVEGVHWDRRATAEDVGWKAVAVNVSDIAAMGGRSSWATLALSLPRPLDPNWIHGFAQGFHAACARWGVKLVGGDTTRSSGPTVVTVTLAGKATHPLTRAGASEGDDIWVTGVPGEAAAGFTHGGPGLRALHRPDPPVDFAVALADGGMANAAMDLSDGLARDLSRICQASGVGASVDPEALPMNTTLRALKDPLPAQVAFGDDYQLLFTASSTQRAPIQLLAQRLNTRVTRVGAITVGTHAELIGRPWPRPGFSHFAPPSESRP